MERTRLEDALESKRQQENFIDMTSHEMRNPLSAMVQCADSALAAINEIIALLKGANSHEIQNSMQDRMIEELDVSLEGISTIISCCAHQKCIIDVLTLSKLDSNLLSITPVKTNPRIVMQDVAKMFDMDAKKADIKLTIGVDDSIDKFGIIWVQLDPARIKQILINLISNAIKFTRSEAVRAVEVKMFASIEAPSSSGTFKYAPASRSVSDAFLTEAEWGTGEIMYLGFTVRDTGRGLTTKEQEKLFHRFVQASPKTHVEYGGSGLGLFITRQLTEMQGGEIGVESENDKGSTFAFYVQTRRAIAPAPISPPSMQASSLTALSLATSTNSGPTASLNPDVTVNEGNSRPRTPAVASEWEPNVLIVEDNTVNARVLEKQLKRLGCKIFLSGNGVEALDFLRTTQLWHENEQANTTVDIILMDIEMPIMGGIECVIRIRDFEKQGAIKLPQIDESGSIDRLRKRLPIISISANARVEQGNEQREAGVDDILSKPFRIPQLWQKIHMLLGREMPSSTNA